jgi:hypothetical protein
MQKRFYLAESGMNIIDGSLGRNTPDFDTNKAEMLKLVDNLKATISKVKEGT